MELQKATIMALEDGKVRDVFDVQFNPTTLRLSLGNQVAGGKTVGNPPRNFTGPSSTTLSVDLIFDTADEGTTENPRSVRDKTGRLERLLVPRTEGEQQQNAPPNIRFFWGDLDITGLV